MNKNMDVKRDSLAYIDSPVDPFNEYTGQDNVEPTDGRPSILITFQNSASYYTSYMGGQGGRGQGGRRKSSEALDSPVQQNHHPIVVMNEYPNPGPVFVAVNSRKQSYDRSYNPFLSPSVSTGPPVPPGPTGPPVPPGPPVPNLPPSRRGSMSLTNTLELPKKRRASMTPGISAAATRERNSPSDRFLASNSRFPPTNSLPRPLSRLGNNETSTLPRGPKIRLPRNSQSMPTLNEIGDIDLEEPELPEVPSPRPSVCSSALTDSQAERRMLVPYQFQKIDDNWTPHQKPSWLSLNLDEERNKVGTRSRSVYVAEIWPSLVCLLTAVLVTLTIYLLISYLYTQPFPTNTRNRILPAHPKFPPPPGYDRNGYPPGYPYNPAQYEHYPPQYPQTLPPPPDP